MLMKIKFLLDVMDAGGDDLQTSDDAYEIYTDPKQFAEVRDALIKAGYKLADAELTMIPQNTTQFQQIRRNNLNT